MSADHTGAMVAFYPHPDVASQLAVDGHEPVEDLHCTLAYLGDSTEMQQSEERLADVVRQWASTQSPLSGQVAGKGLFTNGDTPVTYASPDIPGLAELRQSLVLALEANGFTVSDEHGFQPHITIGYDDLQDYQAPNLPLDFSNVSSVYNDSRTDIPLGPADVVDADTDEDNQSQEIATYNMTDFPTLEACIEALMSSVPLTADGELEGPSTPQDVEEGGAFYIPVLIPEGIASGDGRTFEPGALSTRDLPLPLLWQIQSDSGHDGSVIVGRIDSIERIGGEDDTQVPTEFAVQDGERKPISGLGRARGVFDTGPYGREAERLVRAKMLRGVSADLDEFKASVEHDKTEELSEEEDAKDADVIENEKVSVKNGRVMAATLVPKPALQQCYIIMEDDMPSDDISDEVVPDGEYEEDAPANDALDSSLASIAASAAPVNPPKWWFENPKLSGPTPLTVTDDGRVFGHIAAWNVKHIGLPMATRPPRSASNYAYFRTGVLRTEDGSDVAVGQLTLAGGHAPLTVNATAAVKHYDDTASAVADVTAGEDMHGIWVSGGLRPGVTADQVRTLRASAPSGDWRPINNRLELVAVCQVNVPGFPVARTMVAGGHVTALVAAGARVLAELRDAPMREIHDRIALLEQGELQRERAAALKRITPLAEKRNASLTASIAAARSRIAPTREAKQAQQAALVAAATEARARVAALHFQPQFEEKDHPRDNGGKFRAVLARLGETLTGVQGADEAKRAIGDAGSKADSGDDQGAQDSARTAKARLDEAVRTATDPTAKAQLEDANHALSDALHSVADVATDEGEGMSFGDLPPETQEILQKIFQQATSGIDPGQTLDAGVNDLGNFIKGSKFMSPSAIARAIARWLKEQITPN